jgi:hypothetical protein
MNSSQSSLWILELLFNPKWISVNTATFLNKPNPHR